MIKNQLLKNNCIPALLAGCLTMLFLGCKKEAEPPVAPTAAKPAAAAPAAATPAKPVQKSMSSTLHITPPPVNQFDFSNKKDPFKAFVVAKPVEPAAAAAKKQNRNGLPIHQFDVNQFKLIGVVTGAGESKAMVVDPNGKGYVLKVGMSIGKNDGKVTTINASGVSVTEQFKDDNGRVRRENIKITLPRKM